MPSAEVLSRQRSVGKSSPMTPADPRPPPLCRLAVAIATSEPHLSPVLNDAGPAFWESVVFLPVGTLREDADPDDLILGDGGQDPLASALVSLASVLPAVAHHRDDPDALLLRVGSERQQPVRHERGGRHDV